MRFIAASTIGLLLLPLLASAQTSAELRAKIRADLMADPRSAQLSEAELDTLINALATEAETEGAAEDYFTGGTFDYSAAFADAAPLSPSRGPLFLAVLALAVVLISLAIFLMRRRVTPESPVDLTA